MFTGMFFNYIGLHNVTAKKLTEFLGALFGVSGAVLLSFWPEMSLYAWSLWLLSSFSLAYFAHIEKLSSLLTLQIVFIIVNCSGICNSL